MRDLHVLVSARLWGCWFLFWVLAGPDEVHGQVQNLMTFKGFRGFRGQVWGRGGGSGSWYNEDADGRRVELILNVQPETRQD